MAIGEEESTAAVSSSNSAHKLPEVIAVPTSLMAPDTYPALDGIQNTGGLVTMETVMPGGEGGEVVGGMSQHNGLPGYSPPRERQDSEVTLDVRDGMEPAGLGEEEEEEEDEDET